MTDQIVAQGDVDATAPRYLNRTDASAYLRRVFGVSYTPGSLQQFDILGTGPGAFKVGKNAVYAIGDLDRWVEGKLRASKRGSA